MHNLELHTLNRVNILNLPNVYNLELCSLKAVNTRNLSNTHNLEYVVHRVEH